MKTQEPNELAELRELLRTQIAQFEQELEGVRGFVRKHPIAVTLGAAFIGFVVARWFKKTRIIRVERNDS